ncbi:MAG: transcriptional regulator [bacterium]
MKLTEFFSTYPVFTGGELTDFLAGNGSGNKWTRKALVAYHQKQGRIVSVRRGLYYSVPPGADASKYSPDPFLLASKMTGDAILAYHTALEFYGKAYSVFEEFHYLSRRPAQPLTVSSVRFRGATMPKPLVEKDQESFGVKTEFRAGLKIRVTGLERALVDVLDRPALCGGWEEIWRSLEMVEFFDLDQVVAYALLLENATTAAKVGFFLEQHRDILMVEESHLKPLLERRPIKPHYVARSDKKPGRFVSRWNLVVPAEIIDRTWEAVL